jgi:carboxylesterase
VHGFTGTPEEMRPLGEALAAAGFPVLGIRLAGHGTCIDDLAHTGWRDWFRSVEDGVARLRRIAPRLAVAGMSMGALLGLHLAATRPDDVAALVLCGTALVVRDWRLRWLPLAERFPWLARRYAVMPKAGPRDIADAAIRASSASYDAVPFPAAAELVRLQATVGAELERVTQPALVLHGRHDHTAPLTNVELLRRRLGSRRVEVHVLEESWHVITADVERERVGRLAADFLTRVEAEKTD